MKIYKTKRGIIINHNEEWFFAPQTNLDAFVNRTNLFNRILKEIKTLQVDNSLGDAIDVNALAPIGSQEIWASGVTYMRSREARM